MIYFSSEYSEPASVNAGIIDTSDNLFVFTFLSSILSASFGMAKLLQAGPCRMVKLESYGLGFLLIFLSALSGLMARGLNLGIMVTGKGHSSVNVCFYIIRIFYLEQNLQYVSQALWYLSPLLCPTL